MKRYNLSQITNETWAATCNECGKPFRSDDKLKAISKVTSHISDAHERKQK